MKDAGSTTLVAGSKLQSNGSNGRLTDMTGALDAITDFNDGGYEIGRNPSPQVLGPLQQGYPDVVGFAQDPFGKAVDKANTYSLMQTQVHNPAKDNASKSVYNSEASDVQGRPENTHLSAPAGDVVDRGLLSMEAATRLFGVFVNEIAQHYLAVVFPSGAEAEHIRHSKPVLFLAVISAASGTMSLKFHSTLHREVLQVFADRIILRGEMSLQLIQALLLTASGMAPDDYEDRRFSQYIHMAATMALDLGIDRKQFHPRSLAKRKEAGVDAHKLGSPPLESDSIDAYRTLLGCYVSCSL